MATISRLVKQTKSFLIVRDATFHTIAYGIATTLQNSGDSASYIERNETFQKSFSLALALSVG